MTDDTNTFQCYLEGIGWIMWATEESKPPVRILEEQIALTSPTVFTKPQPDLQKFWYKLNESMRAWDVTYEEALSS